LFLTGTAVFAGGRRQQESGVESAKSPPVKISVEVFDRGTDGGRSDVTKNNWTGWIREKILNEENIDVTFAAVFRWDEVPALNNLMSNIMLESGTLRHCINKPSRNLRENDIPLIPGNHQYGNRYTGFGHHEPEQ
jgi:hypothetical protein